MRNGGADPISAGTAGGAALWGGSSAVEGAIADVEGRNLAFETDIGEHPARARFGGTREQRLDLWPEHRLTPATHSEYVVIMSAVGSTERLPSADSSF